MQKKILIVTNDNVFYLLLKSFLTSTSGSIICQRISKIVDLTAIVISEFSLIIIDSNLKSISAVEFVHILRVDYKLICPIWFFSEIQHTDYLKRLYIVGVNRIIEKPFDPINISKEIILQLDQ